MYNLYRFIAGDKLDFPKIFYENYGDKIPYEIKRRL
jgi:hypothetical protein